jgi:hypothetical protein
MWMLSEREDRHTLRRLMLNLIDYIAYEKVNSEGKIIRGGEDITERILIIEQEAYAMLRKLG